MGAGALFAAVAALGCAGAIKMAPCPAEGGRPWQQVRSPHFLVRTDLSEADARTAALELEGLRAAILAAAWPNLDVGIRPPLEVVVLRDLGEFRMLFGELAGFVVSHPWPMMALSGSPEDWIDKRGPAGTGRTSTVAHELAHYISDLAWLRQPRWLSEGLASFLETVELNEDRSVATIGRLNFPRLQSYRRLRLFPVSHALAWKDRTDHTSINEAFYATSWILVHWLYNTRSEAFVRYQARLIRGDDEATAWRESFPDLDLATIDQQLFAYATNGQYGREDVALRFSEPALTVSPVGDADVHAIRARLGVIAMAKKDRPQARAFAAAELKEALAKGPNNLMALLAGMFYARTLGEAGHCAELRVFHRRAVAVLEAADVDEKHRWEQPLAALDRCGPAKPKPQ